MSDLSISKKKNQNQRLFSDLASQCIHYQNTQIGSSSIQQENQTQLRVGVACSGGLDSMTLAALLVLLSQPHSSSFHRLKYTLLSTSSELSTDYQSALSLLADAQITVFPIIITVDHQLHHESTLHAQGVLEYWDSFHIQTHLEYADPLLIEQGHGVEDGARKARYQALLKVYKEEDLHLILTAHHAFDQVETLLMRLQNPTGAQGMGGIPNWRSPFGRPWLSHPPSVLYTYAQTLDLPHFEDPTNQQQRWLRNRIRHRLLPLFKTVFDSGWETRIHQSAQALRSHWTVSHILLKNHPLTQKTRRPWSVEIDFQTDFLSAPESLEDSATLHNPHIRSWICLNLLECAYQSFYPDHDLRRIHTHLPRLTSLFYSSSTTEWDLPFGLKVWGGRGRLKIYDPNRLPIMNESQVHPLGKSSSFSHILSLWIHKDECLHFLNSSQTEKTLPPSPLKSTWGPWKLEFSLSLSPLEITSKQPSHISPSSESASYLCLPLLDFIHIDPDEPYLTQSVNKHPFPYHFTSNFSFRLSHQGERFHPLGSTGSKKLTKLWNQAQIPPFERKSLPLLVDSKDQIIWAPFIRKGQHPLFLSPSSEKDSASLSHLSHLSQVWIICSCFLIESNSDPNDLR